MVFFVTFLLCCIWYYYLVMMSFTWQIIFCTINYEFNVHLTDHLPPIKYLYINYICDLILYQNISSSSSLPKNVSQIAHKFKHLNDESLLEWRDSNKVKEVITAKEREIKIHSFYFHISKGGLSYVEAQIQERLTWKKDAKESIIELDNRYGL